jgi:beta-galactosidase/beta-glucuronidase
VTQPNQWTPGEPRLATPWTAAVSPDHARPEYPRPQLTRPSWQNLNGVWEFAPASLGEPPPFGVTLAERILVPYPIESALSGIQRHEDRMWYRRTFEVPASWEIGRGNRLRLNFGAVDYKADVWVNRVKVTTHTGGYTKFSVDVTHALSESGPQELIVKVVDRVDATFQPVGKQRRRPNREIFYESASGLWQTVWMEAVPDAFVRALRMVPDLATSSLGLTVDTGRRTPGLSVEAVVLMQGEEIGRVAGRADSRLTVPIPQPRLWSPESPFLYDLAVSLRSGGEPIDSVSSYVGMRQIGLAPGKDGLPRITLNGEPTFLLAALDQGYWPDGIYTAPTEAALTFDLEQHKRLGFNTVRKHLKTEPDRWYHHADRLGLMVWQDMPSMRLRGTPQQEAREQFEAELYELVEDKRSWTCIIGWVPFNEGWGEWSRDDSGRIADHVKALDPTRLVVANSGLNIPRSRGDSGRGDVIDWHEYPGPATPSPDATRAAMDGEHGGYGLQVEDHMWFGEGHGYTMAGDRDELTACYVDDVHRVLTAAAEHGISGAVFTQITDVEHEVNGFLTYDREVEKMDFDQVRAANELLISRAGDRTRSADQASGDHVRR